MEENNISKNDDINLNSSLNDKQIAKTNKGNKIKKNQGTKQKKNLYVWKIIAITLAIAFLLGLLSQIVASKASVYTLTFILIILMFVNIAFDGIALAVTSCDIKPLNSMASRKIKNAKSAIKLVKNAPKVSNICADVIGDIAGIISGACGAEIAIAIIKVGKIDGNAIWAIVTAVMISAIISAITVGGKAAMKKVAIKKALEYVMFTASIVSIFDKESRRYNKNLKPPKHHHRHKKKSEHKEKSID